MIKPLFIISDDHETDDIFWLRSYFAKPNIQVKEEASPGSVNLTMYLVTKSRIPFTSEADTFELQDSSGLHCCLSFDTYVLNPNCG